MRWKKESKTLKVILRVTNGLLLLLTLAAGAYLGYWAVKLDQLPDMDAMEAEISLLETEAADLEGQIGKQQEVVALAEAESLAALNEATEQKDTVQAEYDLVAGEHGELKGQIDNLTNSQAAQEQLKLDIAELRREYGEAIRTLEDMILAGESEYKICYLTFDDGPSYLTEAFLNKIDKLDIKVTFFTIGVQMGENAGALRRQLLRREALSGHAIANHSYSHSFYGSLYKSLDNFVADVKKQDELVYNATGMHTDVFRFPAGSYYCPFRTSAIAELEKMGFGHIDWIGNAYDSGDHKYASATVAANVIRQVREDSVTVVLMHDWRSETLGALETIVTTLKAENYLFLPLFKESSLIGVAYPKWDS